jgi:hypothetical protein
MSFADRFFAFRDRFFANPGHVAHAGLRSGQEQLLFEDSQIMAAPEVMTLDAAEYQIERTADIPLPDLEAKFQVFASQTPLEIRGDNWHQSVSQDGIPPALRHRLP